MALPGPPTTKLKASRSAGSVIHSRVDGVTVGMQDAIMCSQSFSNNGNNLGFTFTISGSLILGPRYRAWSLRAGVS